MNNLILPVQNPELSGILIHYFIGIFLLMNVFVVCRTILPMFRLSIESKPLFYGIFAQHKQVAVLELTRHQHAISVSQMVSAFTGFMYLVMYPSLVTLSELSPIFEAFCYTLFVVLMFVSDVFNHRAFRDYLGGNIERAPKPSDNPGYTRFSLLWPTLYYVGSITFYILTLVYTATILLVNYEGYTLIFAGCIFILLAYVIFKINT